MHHTQPRLTDITFLAFDTETTGLFPILHRMVEVGAVRFRLDDRELATFQQLINPHMRIPEDVQHVYGIPDTLVRGKSTIDGILPQFFEFLGLPDMILLAHNAPFGLGFLVMALTRFGIAYPPHDVFDTLDMARRLYPTWSSHSLEPVATRLKVANKAEHRALSDARLVKDVILKILQHALTVRTIIDLEHLSSPLTFAEAPVSSIEPPKGIEALAMAMTEQCTITIADESGWQRS